MPQSGNKLDELPHYMLHFSKAKSHLITNLNQSSYHLPSSFYQSKNSIAQERLLNLNTEMCFQCELKHFNSMTL